MKRFIISSLLFYCLITMTCTMFEGPEGQGSLAIILEFPQEENVVLDPKSKSPPQIDSTTALDRVHCTVKKGGSSVWEDDLTQEGQYFTANITLDAGSGYSVEVECYENNQNTYFGSQSGITISSGETTTVNITLTVIYYVEIEWEKTFGGSNYDFGNSVQQTSDGGFIIAGRTLSYGAGNSDVYLIKTYANGNEQWSHSFGGSNSDYGESVRQTSDGGYIIAGRTLSYGAGSTDVYLIKTDANGNETWSQTFGGSNSDYGESVRQTSDDGYIIAGRTLSYAGSTDVYLIKTDANGNETWCKTFGGSYSDYSRSVQQTSDGGFVIAGLTYSYGAGNSDVYLIKIDVNGNEIWYRTFGGSYDDIGFGVQQTTDGGFIIAGKTYSYGAGSEKVYLIKTDAWGNETWSKTFDGSGDNYSRSVQQTFDGGYIIAGKTYSYGAGYADVYLIKTDANGNEIWSQTFGGSYDDVGFGVQQTFDGGYIIAGKTYSYGAGYADVYLIKTDANGNEIWSQTFGGSNSDYGESVQQTSDGGYIIAGYTFSFGAGGSDVYLIKVRVNQ